MHDISLGETMRDYLTGEEIDKTTYEDLRQGLARLLVEERGYPRENLKARVGVAIPVDGKEYCRIVDLAAYGDDGSVLLVLVFCSGVVKTYVRESLAAARLFPGGPAPLVVVTDSKDALLVAVATGEHIKEGMGALPLWDELAGLAREHPAPAMSGDRMEKERRILYAYSESLYGCCGAATCAVESRGGRFKE